MSILNFTVEEINLIAIYRAQTKEKTLGRIADELPEMDNEEIITIAESASRKLAELTEPEFSALSFSPADDTEDTDE